MLLILAALLTAAAPQPGKALETCPATAFTLKKPVETKSRPKPEPATVQSAHVHGKANPKAKGDDCLAPKPARKAG